MAASVSAFLSLPGNRFTRIRVVNAADEEPFLSPIQNMKAQEIRAELELRGVSYAGAYDKSDLQNLLRDARATGKCDPEVLARFNANVSCLASVSSTH